MIENYNKKPSNTIMLLKNLSNYLSENELSIFWQYLISINLFFSIYIAFIEDSSVSHILSIGVMLLTTFGFLYLLIKNDRSFIIWGPLYIGVILIKISLLLNEYNYFGAEIDKIIPFWIEQVGMFCIAIFAFSIMFIFEKKLRLDGLTIDFSLLVLSLFILILLITPNLLNTFLYEIELSQQLLITRLLFGFIVLTMTMFLQYITKNITPYVILLILTDIFINIHFSIDLLNSFQVFSIRNNISMSIYHISGVFILMFSFMEKISHHHYHPKNAYTIGSSLMWLATITAIFIIPLSIFIRWYQEQETLDTSIIGIISFLLSSFVIWRLISLIKHYQAQSESLRKVAFIDSLTDLPNYYGLIEEIETTHHRNILIIAINIDGFRSINDLYGRSFGDDVLTSLAKRLNKLPNLINASRVSTDSFLIALNENNKDIHLIIKNIQGMLGVWDTVSGQKIAVPLSFGICHSSHMADLKLLIQHAEDALVEARINHSRYSIYQHGIAKELPRHKLREILQHAIDSNYLPVHYQPIYNLETGELTAMELLIRIQSKESGILMPGQFLDQAEAYGLLTPLTKICVNMITKHYDKLPNVIININMPSYFLQNPNVLNEFINHFTNAGLSPKRFCLEVLEDQDIQADQLLEAIQQLKKLGFKIAMDDFGTGHSSLSRLSVLPFDTIKVDRSLLLAASAGDKTILESAIKLIKRLNLSVVVEGIETIEQLALVKLLGADFVQGYLLSKPVDVKQAQHFHLNVSNIIAEH